MKLLYVQKVLFIFCYYTINMTRLLGHKVIHFIKKEAFYKHLSGILINC